MITALLYDQLSSASQKYKTGVLKVSGGGETWEMVLLNGRIIDVHRSEEKERLELMDRLVSVGALSKQDYMKLVSRRASIDDLEAFLIDKKDVPQDVLAQTRANIALDALYEIGRMPDLDCEFSFQAIRDQRGAGIDINFGQFMLDVVEFGVDEDRASRIFATLRKGNSLVLRGERPERPLPFEEKLLNSLEFPCSFDDLIQAPLSRYELVESLLSLIDQGVIACDQPFDDEPEKVQVVRKQEESKPAVRAPEVVAAQPAPQPEVLPQISPESPEKPTKKRSASGRRFIHRPVVDKLLSWNFRMLEENDLQKIILFTNELFLLAVLLACLAGPQILDTWFQGLSEFTSALVSVHGTLR